MVRDGLEQCEWEIAGRSSSFLWLDGEGDTPGKFRTAPSYQRASRTIARARTEIKWLTTTSGFPGRLYCGASAEDRSWGTDEAITGVRTAEESRFGQPKERRSVRCWRLEGSFTSRGEETGWITSRAGSRNGRPHVRGLRGQRANKGRIRSAS
jgi:hypothetical protein